MARSKFGLNTLGELSEATVAAFQQALEMANASIRDQPHNDAKRTVTLKCDIVPGKMERTPAGNAEPVTAFVECQVNVKVPGFTEKAAEVNVGQGVFTFHHDNRDDAMQGVLEDELNNKKGKGPNGD